MIVLHHMPRTGGTFLRKQLRLHLAPGPEISFGAGRLTPRLLCDVNYRPRVMVYHCSGPEFRAVYRREDGDFTVTFVRDPVELVYSNFAYMQSRLQQGDAPSARSSEWAYYARSMEAHVDDVIEGSVTAGWIETDLDCFDFVGVVEEMPKSIAALNAALGTSLATGPPLNQIQGERSYRRAELASVLAGQRRTYDAALERLLGLRNLSG
jgi:hypothetical protein